MLHFIMNRYVRIRTSEFVSVGESFVKYSASLRQINPLQCNDVACITVESLHCVC